MKKVGLFFIAVIFIFCGCSNDDNDDFEYVVPEFSLQDYYNLIGISYNDFVNKYPYYIKKVIENYSINDEQLLIETFYSGNINKEELETCVYFKNGVCEGLQIEGEQYKEQLDLYFLIEEEINKIAKQKEDRCFLKYGRNGTSYVKFFENRQDLRKWIIDDLPEDKFINGLSFYWTNTIQNSDYTIIPENIETMLFYRYSHTDCSLFNNSTFILRIGNFYIPSMFN